MKQLLIKKGKIEIEEVPPPTIVDGHIIVKTHYSVVSPGTEMAGVKSSGMSIISRAKAQPQNVKKVFKIAKEKGIWKTYRFIKGMLDFGTPTGYSLSGEVVAVGEGVTEFTVGDLVACAGAGKANHAEIVLIPKNLASKIPSGVDIKEAASTTIGSIAMQGVRQADLRVGEKVAVIGLGLLGQLTVQILRASGVNVVGVDLDEERIRRAMHFGMYKGCSPSDAESVVNIFSSGSGTDATIITAATTSNEPMNLAMKLTRKRGKVVVVGAVGLGLNRSPWYEKEIDLRISTSYGPGRYDSDYEEKGLDYPYAYVRWTEKRNMDSYLELLKEKRIKFLPIINKIYEFNDAPNAYDNLMSNEKPLGVILDYKAEEKKDELGATIRIKPEVLAKNKINLALIGAGSFATFVHLPNLQKLRNYFDIKAIITKDGVKAKQLAKQYDVEYCGTDYTHILKDKSINAVLISTRHNLHGKIVLDCLAADKHVFVEKPPTIYREELEKIKNFYKSCDQSKKPYLMVGFNRRFSPYVEKIKELTVKRSTPLIINYRVNAGYLPLSHWTQGQEGGGRILGEACHFFDVFQSLINTDASKIEALSISPNRKDLTYSDNFSAILKYKDGSIAELTYLALGPKDLSKEYCEVFCDNKAYIINDFKELKVFGDFGGFSGSQDKGHFKELELFGKFLKGEIDKAPLALDDIFKVTEISFEVNELLKR